MSLQEFNYEVIDNILIIKVAGELSVFNQKSFDDFLNEHVIKRRSFIFDLSEITHINSMCIGHIIRKSRAIRAFIVEGDNGLVSKVLSLLNVDKTIPVCKTLDEAFHRIGDLYAEENKNS